MNRNHTTENSSADAIDELNNALQSKDRQLSALQDLIAGLQHKKDLKALLHNMTDIMISSTDATQAQILLIDETGKYLQLVAAGGPLTDKTQDKTRHRGVGFAGVAWATGEPQHILNSTGNKLTRDQWPEQTQLVAVPLTAADNVIGVVVLGAPSQSTGFSQSPTLLHDLSYLTSYAIASHEQQEKIDHDLQTSKSISQITQLMKPITNTDQLLEKVSRKLVELLDFTRCTFYIVTEDQELQPSKTWIKNGNDVETTDSLPIDVIEESSCQWSFDNKDTACVLQGVQDFRETDRFRSIRADLNIGSTITIPVVVSGAVFAVLMISKDVNKKFHNEHELNLLTSAMHQLASVVFGIVATNALHHRSYHDSLTDLPNRRQFEEYLQQILKHADRDNSKDGALLFLDLDGFKVINDTLGHAAGDTILQLVAKRLKRCAVGDCIVSRIGGNEFSVIIPSVNKPQEAFKIAQNIRQSILSSFMIGKTVANIGTSIGLRLFTPHTDTVDGLCRDAELALQQAKAAGKNNVVCFDEQMDLDARNKQRIESDIEDALTEKQFILHYQPQVEPIEGKVMGVEALIRWEHPEHGVVSPAEFIPVAEQTGLINEIGAWVLEEAVAQLAAWNNTSLSHLKISINVAATQFLFGGLAARVAECLKAHDVPAEKLEIELTESVVMEDIDLVAAQLRALQDLGVTVALDDFGTGYSSLSYLQDLPIDVLKIDRAFIARLSDEDSNYSLLNAIMLLASGLGLHTVAEGVETHSQLEQIKALGCNLVQGYYYSKPYPASQFPLAVSQIEDQFETRKAA